MDQIEQRLRVLLDRLRSAPSAEQARELRGEVSRVGAELDGRDEAEPGVDAVRQLCAYLEVTSSDIVTAGFGTRQQEHAALERILLETVHRIRSLRSPGLIDTLAADVRRLRKKVDGRADLGPSRSALLHLCGYAEMVAETAYLRAEEERRERERAARAGESGREASAS